MHSARALAVNGHRDGRASGREEDERWHIGLVATIRADGRSRALFRRLVIAGAQRQACTSFMWATWSSLLIQAT